MLFVLEFLVHQDTEESVVVSWLDRRTIRQSKRRPQADPPRSCLAVQEAELLQREVGVV